MGATGDEVQCLESQLVAAGFTTTVDTTFDAATDAAVRAYQTAKSSRSTASSAARPRRRWASGPVRSARCPPPTTTARAHPTAPSSTAPTNAARCATNGTITYEFPITSAWSQPDPGTYPVYAKDLNASSNFGGHYSTMTHFVAFTRGKYKGARIAFHSVPKTSDGECVQPLDSVGTEAYHGESSGCIRVLPDDAVKIWDWLSIGDEVHVIS